MARPHGLPIAPADLAEPVIGPAEGRTRWLGRPPEDGGIVIAGKVGHSGDWGNAPLGRWGSLAMFHIGTYATSDAVVRVAHGNGRRTPVTGTRARLIGRGRPWTNCRLPRQARVSPLASTHPYASMGKPPRGAPSLSVTGNLFSLIRSTSSFSV
jgi:hypothetical protein